jgi:transposase-like protein
MFAKNGLLDTLKKTLAERILDHHLAGERAQAWPETRADQRSRHRRGTADTQQRAKRIGAGLPNDG